MSQELFRREVLDARRGSWLGCISVQPSHFWLLAVSATLVAPIAIVTVPRATVSAGGTPSALRTGLSDWPTMP